MADSGAGMTSWYTPSTVEQYVMCDYWDKRYQGAFVSQLVLIERADGMHVMAFRNEKGYVSPPHGSWTISNIAGSRSSCGHQDTVETLRDS